VTVVVEALVSAPQLGAQLAPDWVSDQPTPLPGGGSFCSVAVKLCAWLITTVADGGVTLLTEMPDVTVIVEVASLLPSATAVAVSVMTPEGAAVGVV
jgi:hypothetical protein